MTPIKSSLQKLLLSGLNAAPYIESLRNEYGATDALIFTAFKTIKATEKWILELLSCTNIKESDRANILARVVFNIDTSDTFNKVFEYSKKVKKTLRKKMIMNLLSVYKKIPDHVAQYLLNEIQFGCSELSSPQNAKYISAFLNPARKIETDLAKLNIDNALLAALFVTSHVSEKVGLFLTYHLHMNLKDTSYYKMLNDDIFTKLDSFNQDINFEWDLFNEHVKLRALTISDKFFNGEFESKIKSNDLMTVNEFYEKYVK